MACAGGSDNENEQEALRREMENRGLEKESIEILFAEGFTSHRILMLQEKKVVQSLLKDLQSMNMAQKGIFLRMIPDGKEDMDKILEIQALQLMTKEHIRLLVRNTPELAEKMRINELIPRLRAREILSKHEADTCKSFKTDLEKGTALLECLQKGSDSVFYSFIRVLIEVNQEHLAALLDQEGRFVKVGLHIKSRKRNIIQNKKERECVKALEAELGEEAEDGGFVINNEENIGPFEQDGRSFKQAKLGSIDFIIHCPTIKSLESLKRLCSSQDLIEHFTRVLKFEEHTATFSVPDLYLSIELDEESVDNCKEAILQHDFLFAVCRNEVTAVEKILQRGLHTNTSWPDGFTGLHVAALNNFLEIGNILLKNRAKLDIQTTQGQTPLHLACQAGNKEFVEFLLNAGADSSIPDCNGNTAVHTTSYYGHPELLTLLIEHGADINVKNKAGLVPIHVASSEGHSDIVRNFGQKMEDINISTPDGSTSLSVACRRGRLDCVRVLRELGAYIEVENNQRYRPLHEACAGNHAEVVKELLDYGAATRVFTADGQLPCGLGTSAECKDLIHNRTEHVKQHEIFGWINKTLTPYGITRNFPDEISLADSGLASSLMTQKDDKMTDITMVTAFKGASDTGPGLRQIWRNQAEGAVWDLELDTRTGKVLVAEYGLHRYSVYNTDGLCEGKVGRREKAGVTMLCIDTKRGYTVHPGSKEDLWGLSCMDNQGQEVRWIVIPGARHLGCVVYCEERDLYVVGDIHAHCLWFIEAENGKVIRQVTGTEVNQEGNIEKPYNLYHHHTSEGECQIYVTDLDKHCISVYTIDGEYIRKFGSEGLGDGQLYGPLGVCVDNQGRVVVCDIGNKGIVRYWLEGDTEHWDCIVTREQFRQDEIPMSVTVTPDGYLMVGSGVNDDAGFITCFEYSV